MLYYFRGQNFFANFETLSHQAGNSTLLILRTTALYESRHNISLSHELTQSGPPQECQHNQITQPFLLNRSKITIIVIRIVGPNLLSLLVLVKIVPFLCTYNISHFNNKERHVSGLKITVT